MNTPKIITVSADEFRRRLEVARECRHRPVARSLTPGDRRVIAEWTGNAGAVHGIVQHEGRRRRHVDSSEILGGDVCPACGVIGDHNPQCPNFTD